MPGKYFFIEFFDVCLMLALSLFGCQRFGAWRRSGFRSTKMSASTELDTKQKASFKHWARFFVKRLLAAAFIFVQLNFSLINNAPSPNNN
ncbi:MAG: hypothetical protein H0W84_04495 [Bacteroidetes bacterium]|nr:hypothetical protein [Bacteroidota bacterium]